MGRGLLGVNLDLFLIRHIRRHAFTLEERKTASSSVGDSDRGYPLGTVIDRPSGTQVARR
jgi:hypothetical protein